MKFCKKCNNSFEPDQESITAKKMFFKCRSCGYREEASQEDYKIGSEIYHTEDFIDSNIVHMCDNEILQIKHIKCKNKDCKNEYIKYIKQPVTLKIIYICNDCKTYWST